MTPDNGIPEYMWLQRGMGKLFGPIPDYDKNSLKIEYYSHWVDPCHEADSIANIVLSDTNTGLPVISYEVMGEPSMTFGGIVWDEVVRSICKYSCTESRFKHPLNGISVDGYAVVMREWKTDSIWTPIIRDTLLQQFFVDSEDDDNPLGVILEERMYCQVASGDITVSEVTLWIEDVRSYPTHNLPGNVPVYTRRGNKMVRHDLNDLHELHRLGKLRDLSGLPKVLDEEASFLNF